MAAFDVELKHRSTQQPGSGVKPSWESTQHVVARPDAGKAPVVLHCAHCDSDLEATVRSRGNTVVTVIVAIILAAILVAPWCWYCAVVNGPDAQPFTAKGWVAIISGFAAIGGIFVFLSAILMAMYEVVGRPSLGAPVTLPSSLRRNPWVVTTGDEPPDHSVGSCKKVKA
jgi:hypothetical protein